MSRRWIIAVTGTPGTGKTTVSKRLAERINALVLDLTDIIEKNNLYIGKEMDGTKIVEIPRLRSFVNKKLKETKRDIIIDGHLSQFMPITHVIVLRTSPLEIKTRLSKRGYSAKKIKENVEAELMAVCLHDCDGFENVLELDTTYGFNTDDIVNWLKMGGRNIKNLDWSEGFIEFLTQEK